MNEDINIVSLYQNMQELIRLLDIINHDNFESYIGPVNKSIEHIKKLKKITGECENIPEISELSKLIDIKFDNVIGTMKSEIEKTSIELASIQNKKKLVNYRR